MRASFTPIMGTRLRQLFETIDRNHPSIGATIWSLYRRKGFNRVRRAIRGRNNRITCGGASLSAVVFDIEGNGNKIEIMPHCRLINLVFHIRGDNHSVFIDQHCRFDGGGVIWMEDSDCSLAIGELSTFENVDFALSEPGSQITIGRDCMFAYDVDVRTGDSHSIISEETHERINYAENVCIGDHVWIASHCAILKGSSIAENSVVATNSVVTQRFETKGTLIGGIPARQLREGITWSRKKIYKVSK